MTHDLILFGVGTSRTMRAHWMLLELGLDYESRALESRSGETLTEEFRRLNPRHKPERVPRARRCARPRRAERVVLFHHD